MYIKLAGECLYTYGGTDTEMLDALGILYLRINSGNPEKKGKCFQNVMKNNLISLKGLQKNITRPHPASTD